MLFCNAFLPDNPIGFQIDSIDYSAARVRFDPQRHPRSIEIEPAFTSTRSPRYKGYESPRTKKLKNGFFDLKRRYVIIFPKGASEYK